jgi:transcriptional regulator with XRE-family HTH domain
MNGTFAEKLAYLRAQKGLTQRELAAEAGIAWSMISKYESGKSAPRLKVLMRLAEALGVTTESLQGEDASSLHPVELYEGFSARLLEARQDKKISMRLLAKRSGIDTSTLTQFEIGDMQPSADELHRLAEALGVKVTDLAGNKNEKENVRIRLVFKEDLSDSVVVATTPAQYQSLIERAAMLGLTPGEVLDKILEIASEALKDPENASEAAKELLKDITYDEGDE